MVKKEVWWSRGKEMKWSTGVGCPNFALQIFCFEAKLSKTETVLLRFTSVLQNHKKSFASYRFVSLCFAKKAFRYGIFALKKSFASVVLL